MTCLTCGAPGPLTLCDACERSQQWARLKGKPCPRRLPRFETRAQARAYGRSLPCFKAGRPVATARCMACGDYHAVPGLGTGARRKGSACGRR